MDPLIFLDFDGVLFDSVPEVYKVCLEVSRSFPEDYVAVSFEEFSDFRSYLTDAWQFNRLFSRHVKLNDFSTLSKIEPTEQDWIFARMFFAARQRLMEDDFWAEAMKPYEFFLDIKPSLIKNNKNFIIISTRNEESIERTLAYHGIQNIRVFGQAAVRTYGSKLKVIKELGFLQSKNYMVYVDDMRAHLKPFQNEINLCLQADWGYDTVTMGSYSQQQVASIVKSLFR